MIDTVTCTVPSPTNKTYIEVDESGLVLTLSPCNCYEYAVPFIFQEDIVITQGKFINVPMQASNNPTIWRVLGSCDSYTFTGGDTGSIYDIVDCYGNNKRITVGTLNSESSTLFFVYFRSSASYQ